MKVLKTPWKNELMDLVSSSKKSIKITSPFVKGNICSEILSKKNLNVHFELITSFKLLNIYSGSLDLGGLEQIIKSEGVVKNYSNLHSKIYLFDERKVIISSGNLTSGGLLNNYEYGIYSSDSELVDKVSSDFLALSNDENIGVVKLKDIEKVRQIISNIAKKEAVNLPNFELENLDSNFKYLELDHEAITSSLSGWKLEIFKCITLINSYTFTLSQINQFENHLKEVFPSNNHVLEKIRQQLQQLRDLGLIEFLGNGNYRKLWIEKRNT
jgi:hypothetical protein